MPATTATDLRYKLTLTTQTTPTQGWAMTATDTHWHYWIGDRTVCGLDRDTPWTLGHVQAGDCPACTDRLARLAGAPS